MSLSWILYRIGEPPRPPPVNPRRRTAPPDDAAEPLPNLASFGQPEHEFKFDQRVPW